MRILFGGGSTGGHLYPAMAVVEQLSEAGADVQPLFAITGTALEHRILSRAGLPFVPLRAGPVTGGSIVRAAAGLARQPFWIAEARRVLRRFKPDLVVGTGGQVSGPLLAAAAIERVPSLLIELNVKPGLSNRLAGRIVSAAAVAWPEAADTFGARAFVSGVPVRASFASMPPPSTNGPLGIAVIGGSEGSSSLNRAIRHALPSIAGLRDRIHVVGHAAGPAERDVMTRAYADNGVRADVTEYFDDIASIYARSGLVIAHAGGSTCGELAASGRPSILVPLETSAGRHQAFNAAAMHAAGAAVVVADDEDAGGTIAAAVVELLEPLRRTAMSHAARAIARTDTENAIVQRLFALVSARRRSTAASIIAPADAGHVATHEGSDA